MKIRFIIVVNKYPLKAKECMLWIIIKLPAYLIELNAEYLYHSLLHKKLCLTFELPRELDFEVDLQEQMPVLALSNHGTRYWRTRSYLESVLFLPTWQIQMYKNLVEKENIARPHHKILHVLSLIATPVPPPPPSLFRSRL